MKIILWRWTEATGFFSRQISKINIPTGMYTIFNVNNMWQEHHEQQKRENPQEWEQTSEKN